MKNINQSLKIWLDDLQKNKKIAYENFPDIDLYMDQLLTYLDKSLSIYALSSLDKQITSSMINNYVKGEVIPNPISKKYTKQHISLLLEVCTLKRILSLAEIKQILDAQYAQGPFSDIYNEFSAKEENLLKEEAKQISQSLSSLKDNDCEELTKLAINLSLKANANIVIAQRILNYIKLYNETEKNNEDDKDKKKK